MNFETFLWGILFLFATITASAQTTENYPRIFLKETHPLFVVGENSGLQSYYRFNLCNTSFSSFGSEVFILSSPTDTLKESFDFKFEIYENDAQENVCSQNKNNQLQIQWFIYDGNEYFSTFIENTGSGSSPKGFFAKSSKNGMPLADDSGNDNGYLDTLKDILSIPRDLTINPDSTYEIPCNTNFSDKLLSKVVGFNDDPDCNSITALSMGRRIRRFHSPLAESRNGNEENQVDTLVWEWTNNCGKSGIFQLKIKENNQPPTITINDFHLAAILDLELNDTLNQLDGQTITITRCEAAEFYHTREEVIAFSSLQEEFYGNDFEIISEGLNDGSNPANPIATNGFIQWRIIDGCRNITDVKVNYIISEEINRPPIVIINDFDLASALGLKIGDTLNTLNGQIFSITRCDAVNLYNSITNPENISAISFFRNEISSNNFEITYGGFDNGSILADNGFDYASPICEGSFIRWRVMDECGNIADIKINLTPFNPPTVSGFNQESENYQVFKQLLFDKGVVENELKNLSRFGDTFLLDCAIDIPDELLNNLVYFSNVPCNMTTALSMGRKIRRFRDPILAESRNNETNYPALELQFSYANPCEAEPGFYSMLLLVNDTIPPIFTSIPSAVTIRDIEIGNLLNPTISDKCDSYDLHVKSDTLEQSNPTLRIVNRTWTATDLCGNASSATQKITVLLEPKNNCHSNCQLQIPCPDDLYIIIPKGQEDAPITWTPPLPVQMNCAMETTQCAPTPITGFQFIGAFQGSKYYLSSNQEDVEDAIAICQANGGTLLSIDNGDENNFLIENMDKIVHIGINDLEQENVFKRTDGTMPTYFNWGDFYLNNSTNNYGIFQPWDGSWSLVNQWVYKHFVLEIPCNTETPPIMLTQTAGPMNGTPMKAGTYNIGYEAAVCEEKAICNFALTVVNETDCGNECQGINYCESSGVNPWEEWIAHVGLGNIQHTSEKDGFGDFTNLSTSLFAGQRYDMTVTTNFSWQNEANYLRGWIDYNQNDVFEEDEIIFQEIIAVSANFEPIRNRQFSIIVPSNLSAGSTRMRISLNRGQYATPCATLDFGEVEDYSILLENGSQNRAIPTNQLTFTAFVANEHAALQWASNSGYKNDNFEVQHSTDGLIFSTIATLQNEDYSNQLSAYQYEHNYWSTGINYYRIRQNHKDNTFIITAPKKVIFEDSSNSFSIFPNPTQNELFLNLKKWAGKPADIQLFNLLGETKWNLDLSNIPDNLLKIDLTRLPSGIYFLSVKVDGRPLKTERVYLERLE